MCFAISASVASLSKPAVELFAPNQNGLIFPVQPCAEGPHDAREAGGVGAEAVANAQSDSIKCKYIDSQEYAEYS